MIPESRPVRSDGARGSADGSFRGDRTVIGAAILAVLAVAGLLHIAGTALTQPATSPYKIFNTTRAEWMQPETHPAPGMSRQNTERFGIYMAFGRFAPGADVTVDAELSLYDRHLFGLGRAASVTSAELSGCTARPDRPSVEFASTSDSLGPYRIELADWHPSSLFVRKHGDIVVVTDSC